MSVTSVPTGARHVRRAWLSLALLPVALVAAFAVGEGLVTLLGAEPHGAEAAPLWVVLLAFPPAFLLLSVPAALAWHQARLAAAEGDRRGRVPAVIGGVVTGWFLLTNLASYVVDLVR
ncbi:hypothetical protein GCM10009623_19900 [Nocardioides aestuarii]|uniref:Uncharacterized protein n=1 Tax=Nocardioides aestuarii TaxID=252231 RepID=A0ABW4TN34_9ACTN